MFSEANLLESEHGNRIVLIERLWFSQAGLKRLQQMHELIAHVYGGGLFDLDPLIELHQNEDEEIVINSGHHRVTAVWLSGRTFLYHDEFKIFYKDAYRPPMGKIDVFLKRLPSSVLACLQQIEIADHILNQLHSSPGQSTLHLGRELARDTQPVHVE